MKKHRYNLYFRKTNDKEKGIKAVQTFKDNYGTQERRAKRAGALADRFSKCRSVEKSVWKDEKNFTLEVSLNSQNSRVYGFKNKDNIENNRLLYHTNRQSKKGMVSAYVVWKGATKQFFVNDKVLKISSKTKKYTWKKSFFPKLIVLWLTALGFLFKRVDHHIVPILFKVS